ALETDAPGARGSSAWDEGMCTLCDNRLGSSSTLPKDARSRTSTRWPRPDAKSMHNSGQFDTSKRNGASASTLTVPIWRRPEWMDSLRLLAAGDPAPFTARLGGVR